MATGGQALNRPTLPAGYRFSPNNDDLIVYYLKRKVLGQPRPADIIPTTDVYASSPNKVPLADPAEEKDAKDEVRWRFKPRQLDFTWGGDSQYWKMPAEG
ncbi:hypothetical protein OIU77_009111, partial [Salix suchowensis]